MSKMRKKSNEMTTNIPFTLMSQAKKRNPLPHQLVDDYKAGIRVPGSFQHTFHSFDPHNQKKDTGQCKNSVMM